jgi:hypothetical protein
MTSRKVNARVTRESARAEGIWFAMLTCGPARASKKCIMKIGATGGRPAKDLLG